MKAPENSISSEKGQSLVEFAVSMVILVILLAGIVDAGRALFTFMALREAAQEGALYGSTDPNNTSAIINRVHHSSNLLEDLDADPNANLAVLTTVTGSACTGHAIRVRVSYNNFPITMPFLGVVIGSQTVPISASVTDTILTPSCN